MDPYTTTIVTDHSTIRVEQGSQVAQWAQLLSVTERELRIAVALVGSSAREVRAHFGKREQNTAPDGATPCMRFSHDPDAVRACQLIGLLHACVYQREDVREELTHLVGKLVKAIGNGSLRLDYRAPANDAVAIPPFDDPLYVQALLYWRMRLGTTLELLVEACARLEPNPSMARVRAMFNKIAAEERSARTDFADYEESGDAPLASSPL